MCGIYHCRRSSQFKSQMETVIVEPTDQNSLQHNPAATSETRPLYLSSTNMRDLDAQIVHFFHQCNRTRFDVVFDIGPVTNKCVREAIAHVVLRNGTRTQLGGFVEILIQYPRWLNIVWNIRGALNSLFIFSSFMVGNLALCCEHHSFVCIYVDIDMLVLF